MGQGRGRGGAGSRERERGRGGDNEDEAVVGAELQQWVEQARGSEGDGEVGLSNRYKGDNVRERGRPAEGEADEGGAAVVVGAELQQWVEHVRWGGRQGGRAAEEGGGGASSSDDERERRGGGGEPACVRAHALCPAPPMHTHTYSTEGTPQILTLFTHTFPHFQVQGLEQQLSDRDSELAASITKV